MSRTKKFQQLKAKTPNTKHNNRIYFCSICGLNEVNRPGALCWECEIGQEEVNQDATRLGTSNLE